MRLRKTLAEDLPAILRIHRQAFGQEEEAELTRAILADPTAQPALSLLAEEDGRPLGHVLFSRVRLPGAEAGEPGAILAPLAVKPEAQGRGIGGRLIRAGLEQLRAEGVALVFVLGDPGYYCRHGFAAAGREGLDAPYPIPEEHAEAWMVQALTRRALGRLRGRIACCEALMKPGLWQE